MKINPSSAVAITFLWLGFVGAISFMEAWLKFRAPGITLPLGLGIGRLVFGALNKVEWVLAIALLVPLLRQGFPLGSSDRLLLIPLVILLLQTVWLLPVLDHRAALHIEGQMVEKSLHHVYYVGCELVKVVFLVWFGVAYLRGLSSV